MLQITHAVSPWQINQARTLIMEYIQTLSIDLSFQDFEQEMTDFPGPYSQPSGRLLLSLNRSDATGCVGIRRLKQAACELKRLYVRPAYRGQGLGRKLIEAALEQARAIGYSTVYLDTLPDMNAAVSLYQNFGFQRTAPYYVNPIQGALFFELRL